MTKVEIVAFLLGLIGGIAACAAGVLLSRRREKAPVVEKPKSRRERELERQLENLLSYDGTSRGQREWKEEER